MRVWGKILILSAIFVALVLYFCPPVSAASAFPFENKTVTITDVSSYSMAADNGYWIYQIIIDAIPMGKNQTHTLRYNDAEFILSIGSVQSWGIFNDFDISLTYPNGSVETKHITSTRVSLGEYKTTIQPVFTHLASGYFAYATIDLEIGLDPITTGFGTQPADWDASTAIPFTEVSGTIGESTNVIIYQITYENFETAIRDYDPWFGFTEFIDEFKTWAFDKIIEFINSIPGVGPQFLATLSLILTAGAEILWWLAFVVENILLIIAGGAVFLAVIAVIVAKGNGVKAAGYWVSWVVAIVKGFIWLIGELWHWLSVAVSIIVSVIQAVGKILGL